MSVRKSTLRGRPVWLVEVKRDKGNFHRRRFLDRRHFLKTDALAIEAQLLAEFSSSKHQETPCNSNNPSEPLAQASGSIPFSAFAAQFLNLQDPLRTGFDNKQRNMNLHLLPFFGDTPLKNISRMMVDQFRVRLRTSPVRDRSGPRKPKTINNILTTLRTVLNLAYEYELINRVPTIKKEPVPKRDPEGLAPGEPEQLLEATAPEWRPLIHTALLTGLRRGELYELRWRDINLDCEDPFIRVTRSVVIKSGTYRVKSTKGMRGRTVPLCTKLAKILRRHRLPTDRPDDLVFTEDSGGYMREKRLYRLVVDAGARALNRHVRPHMLRHTFASRAYQEGVPAQVIQMWLGHADITTTQRYAHVRPETGRDLIERLAPLTAARENRVGGGNNRGNNKIEGGKGNAV